MKRRSRSSRPQAPASKPFASTSSSSSFNYTNIAIWAGIFILGIGVGIAFSSGATVNPENVVSREVIDRSAPNAELCVQYGASAMVTDMRVFVTLNPFNVYVTQPSMRPGCVLRRNNWAVLEQKKAVSAKQVRECKNRLNTFGFTGDLDSSPEIECIYQNEAADNLFLNQPGTVGPRPETDRF
ncbi:MAG: DUF3172 domain-containing protein [Symploca sp. SIO2G7]|nr:DUF3172 domain-containing protein [Symploca sp. SIO2G7]